MRASRSNSLFSVAIEPESEANSFSRWKATFMPLPRSSEPAMPKLEVSFIDDSIESVFSADSPLTLLCENMKPVSTAPKTEMSAA